MPAATSASPSRDRAPKSDAPTPVLPVVTRRQAECLGLIYDYLHSHRDYPTQRELAAAMNIKQSSAAAVLSALEKKGYLVRVAAARRNIRLSEAAIEKLDLLNRAGAERQLTLDFQTDGAAEETGL